MKAYYTKLYTLSLGFIIFFTIQSSLHKEDSFEQIERDLCNIEEEAIAQIYKAFSLIPQDAWKNVLNNIDLARKKTRKLLCINPKQAYFFQPKLDKNGTEKILSDQVPCNKENTLDSKTSLFDMHKECSLDRYSLLMRICMEYRNIKPDSISIDSFYDENGAIAYAESGYLSLQWSLLDWCLKISTISKMQSLKVNTAYFKKFTDWYSPKECIINQINVINHEITHLIEAHGLICGILEYAVKDYYPNANLDKHPQFIGLQKTHELIAEIVPRMLCLPSALAEEKKQYKAPSATHPSSEDLKPWVKRIISCYKNYYGENRVF